MMRTQRSLAFVFLCPLLCFLAHPVSAGCTTEALKIQPVWLSSIALDPATNRLLLADSRGERLLFYDTKTGVIEVDEVKTLASLTAVDGGFLVQKKGEPFVIDKQGAMRSIHGASTLGPDDAFSLYPSWVARGATFAGFGSLGPVDLARPSDPKNPDRPYRLGFLRGKVSVDRPQFRTVELIHQTENNDFYLLGFPYFAANNIGLFTLRMDEKLASIARIPERGKSGLQPLRAFPDRFRTVPTLNSKLPVIARFEQIEGTKMAVGLFGQGSYLYVLTREQVGDVTEWLLHQIHPSEPKPLGSVRLPTTANFLSIAVGPEEWFLVERSKVLGWGKQEIKTLVRVPTSWISSPATSPLNADDPQILTCPLIARQGSDQPKRPRPPAL